MGFSEPDPADDGGNDDSSDSAEDTDGPGDFVDPGADDGDGSGSSHLGSPPADRSNEDDDPWAGVKSEDELRQGSHETAADRARSDEGEDTSSDSDDDTEHTRPFSERVKSVLGEYGLDPSDLAEVTGLGKSEAGRIKSGAVEPTTASQRRIITQIRENAPAVADARDNTEQVADAASGSPDPPDANPGGATPESVSEQVPDVDPGGFAEEAVPNELADSLRAAASQVEMVEALQGFDGDLSEMEIIAPDVSCANCTHRNVCIILSSFAPKLSDQGWDAGTEDEGSPVEPMDFAKICDAYDPEGDGQAAPTQQQR